MNPNINVISQCQRSEGDNHDLWDNQGTWWLHCTIHMPDSSKWRLHRNLRTSDVQTARQLRDHILMRNPANLAS
jgi:hypothetical protein